MRAKLTMLLLALVVGGGVAACGEDDEPASDTAATPGAPRTETASAGGIEGVVQGAPKKTDAKPAVPAAKGDPPGELVIRDIVKGKGPKAKAGGTLTMQYVG